MNPLCIYHGGCDDGFGAAWAVRTALGVNVQFHPGVYQEAPPDVSGRDVIMVDFSYKLPVILEMEAKARSILILDHHKTAQEDLAVFKTPWPSWEEHRQGGPDHGPYTRALFDMNRSGAGMAWDYFMRPAPRPQFIDYIEDRDLWRKALPGGDEFTICLRSHPQDFGVWDQLALDPYAMISEGRAIQRYYRARCDELKASAYLTEIAGVPCAISNAPYFAASEVAGELCDVPGASFGACYFEVAKGVYQYSLRSRGNFDVSEIAKKFGGGGHRNAAGFKTSGNRGHSNIGVPAFLRKDPVPLP